MTANYVLYFVLLSTVLAAPDMSSKGRKRLSALYFAAAVLWAAFSLVVRFL